MGKHLRCKGIHFFPLSSLFSLFFQRKGEGRFGHYKGLLVLNIEEVFEDLKLQRGGSRDSYV